jgi:hypothetical protein
MIVNPEDGSLTVTVYRQRVRLGHACQEALHKISIEHPE